MNDPRRTLPAVGVLLETDVIRQLAGADGGGLLARATREAVASVRAGTTPAPVDPDGWAALVNAQLSRLRRPSLRRVVNATGVILHTNLGRAPLARAAIDAIVATAGGATNLEYDLAEGGRGSRYVHAVDLLRELTGADDALVVNNCAAALVLALNTMADGRDAIISRGELIEIGGAFRVPDIMARSGARLREVGTTNRTHLADYRAALTASAGALVKVHRSNFEQRGFVADVPARELVPLARESGVPLLHDYGSGLLIDLAPWGLSGEPTAREVVRDAASIVVMSGDKLLGGPQAGILLGDAEWIARCRANPLTRALRVDKLTLAALEATLQLYRDPDVARRDVPILAMLTAPLAALQERVAALNHATGLALEVVETEATPGGGAFPSARIPSLAVVVPGGPEREPALRDHTPPIVGRIEHDRLLLDLRSVAPSDDAAIAAALTR